MKKKTIILIVISIVAFVLITPTHTQASWLGDDAIYKAPGIDTTDKQKKEGLDDMIKDAQKFENEKGATVGSESGIKGNQSQTFEINSDKLQDFSSNLFSVIMVAATAVSILVGIYIGIKYMVGSVDEKAEYKKMLLPYVVGCIAVYGALGIWKVVVTVLGAV